MLWAKIRLLWQRYWLWIIIVVGTVIAIVLPVWYMAGMEESVRRYIIGINMDLGQSRRGVDVGPSAIRYADLSARLGQLGYDIVDTGNIQVPVKDSLDDDEVVDCIHNACEAVYHAARAAIADGCIPIFLGGDHSIAMRLYVSRSKL